MYVNVYYLSISSSDGTNKELHGEQVAVFFSNGEARYIGINRLFYYDHPCIIFLIKKDTLEFLNSKTFLSKHQTVNKEFVENSLLGKESMEVKIVLLEEKFFQTSPPALAFISTINKNPELTIWGNTFN